MKTATSIFRNVFIAVAAVLLALNLWQIVSRYVFHSALPTVAGYAWATVLTGSMEPTISAGDVIVTHREESYNMGDVVIYDDGESLVTHRLIGYDDQNRMIIRGDANNTCDEPVLPRQVQGRVVHVIPKLGRVVVMLSKPTVLPLLIAFIVVMEICFRLLGEISKKKRQ